ncbi:homeobox protein homothorax [Ditylenchus destructor]|nr:homeobox protein homothorax [Ditylenchus destructor]
MQSTMSRAGEEQRIESDKKLIREHPLFPLLSTLFTKCENAMLTSEETTFNEDIQQFISKVQQDNPSYTPNAEVDTLMLNAIQVLRYNMLEMNRMHELADTFRDRYVKSLRIKLSDFLHDNIHNIPNLQTNGDLTDDEKLLDDDFTKMINVNPEQEHEHHIWRNIIFGMCGAMQPIPGNRILYGALASFSRKELFYLSLICRKFHSIVEKCFPLAPHFVFRYMLRCSSTTKWTWKRLGQIRGIDVPNALIAELPTVKFLRSSRCEFDALSFCSANEILPHICHLWEGQKLYIRCSDYTPDIELARLLSKSLHLHMWCLFNENTDNFLREILLGNCNVVTLTGISDNFTFQMDVAVITDFLFRPVSNESHGNGRLIKLYTFGVRPTLENREELFEAIKQRFVSEKRSHDFIFQWNGAGDTNIRKIRNAHTNQQLLLTGNETSYAFSFRTIDN